MGYRMNHEPAQQEVQYEDHEVDWKTIDLPGWFECRINYEAAKEAKSGGRYLAVAFRVTAGDPTGATVWGQFTISNRNPKAVEVGSRQMGELMWATGLKKGADSSALKGKSLMVRVVGEDDERYGYRARALSFKPIAREPDRPEPQDAGFQSDPGVDMPTDASPPVDAYARDDDFPF